LSYFCQDDVNRKIGINKLGDLQVTTFWGYAATISRKEDMMIYTGRSQQMQKLDALRSCPILLIGTMLLLRTLWRLFQSYHFISFGFGSWMCCNFCLVCN